MKSRNQHRVKRSLIDVQQQLHASSILTRKVLDALYLDDLSQDQLANQHAVLVARVEDTLAHLKRLPITDAEG